MAHALPFPGSLFLALLAAATLLFPGTFLHAATEGETPSPLHEAMEILGTNLRKLNRQIDEPAKLDSSKALLASMAEAAGKAKALEPPLEPTLTDAERAERLANYRKRMETVLETIDQAGKALAAEDFAAAKEKVKALIREREEGHKAFDVEE